MNYIGDFKASETIRLKFTTADVFSSPPSFAVYKDNSIVQSTAGVVFTEGFDSLDRLHQIVVDLSSDQAFYSPGSDFSIVATAGEVSGQSIAGNVIRSFSIENRATTSQANLAFNPAALVRRSELDTTPIYFTFPTGSLADVDFTKSKRINGGASAGISGAITFLYTEQGEHWYSLAYNAADRPVGVGSVQYFIGDGTNDIAITLRTVSYGSPLNGNEIRTAVGLSAANLDAQLSTIDSVSDAIKAKTDNLPASPAATGDIPSLASIVSGVWSEPQAGYTAAGTFGYFLDATVSSAATGGTPAGDIADAVRTELTPELSLIDASISSRLASSSYTAPDNLSIAAILADTNELQDNQGNWVTATGFSTHTAADVVAAMQLVADDFKADVSNLSADVNVIEVAGVPVAGVSDFRANVSALATSAQVSTIDANVDAILMDTSTTIPGQISGLNNLSAADVDASLAAYDAPTKAELDAAQAAIIANTPTTTEIQAALIDEGDGQQLIDAILQVINSSLDLPPLELAAIAQAVRSELATELARIDANISSRLASGGYTAPDNASISAILADTNELQTNQSNWVTATGFSTHNPADVVAAMQLVADDFKANTGGLATSAALATVDANVDAILVDTSTTIPTQINSLNDLSTADIDARLAAYDPPTKAEMDAALAGLSSHTAADVVAAMQVVADDFKADVSGLATSAQVTTIDVNVDAILADTSTTIPAQISGLNNLSNADIDARLAAYDAPTKAELDAAVAGLSSHTADDVVTAMQIVANDFKADVSGLASQASVDALNDLSAADIDARLEIYDAPTKAELDAGLAALSFSTHSAADVLSAMLMFSDDFKADVSGLATQASVDVIDGNVDTILEWVQNGAGAHPVNILAQQEGVGLAGLVIVAYQGPITVAWGYTDQDGEITFNLDAGNYTFAVRTSAGFITPPTATLSVPAENSHTFEIVQQDLTPATAPGLCNVHFTVLDGAYPVAGASVSAMLVGEANTTDKAVILNSVTQASTDSNGEAVLALVQKSYFKRGGKYELEVKVGRKTSFKRLVHIPEQPAVYAEDLPEVR